MRRNIGINRWVAWWWVKFIRTILGCGERRLHINKIGWSRNRLTEGIKRTDGIIVWNFTRTGDKEVI
jgi:hypothetical protein